MILSSLFLVLAAATAAPAAAPAKAPAPAAAAQPRVVFETTKGKIVVELDAKKAPKTVANFLQYVKAGHYNGTIFHRVIPGFMVQGGGFTADMTQKPAPNTVMNEADNGLSNARGTVAMARTGDPHSASAQFFINLVDNNRLDHTGKNAQGWGYCVFGKVVEGMEVADQIAKVSTGNRGPYQNVPSEPITITKATVEGAK